MTVPLIFEKGLKLDLIHAVDEYHVVTVQGEPCYMLRACDHGNRLFRPRSRCVSPLEHQYHVTPRPLIALRSKSPPVISANVDSGATRLFLLPLMQVTSRGVFALGL